MESQENHLILLLHLADAILAAVTIPILLKVYGVPFSQQYHFLIPFVFLLAFIVFYYGGIYRSWRGSRVYRECLMIARAWVVLSGLLFFVFFITKSSTHFSRKVLLTWIFLTPVLMMSMHIVARFFLRALRKRGFDIKQAVIVGAGKAGYEFASFVSKNPWTGIKIAGYFDDRVTPRENDRPEKKICRLGAFRDIENYLSKNKIDYIYLVLPMRAQDRIEYVLSLTRTGGARVFLVPDLFSYYMQNAEIQFLEDRMLLNFNPEQPEKRRFDILFSFLVLLTTAPLFLIIAMLIKLEDNGPVFYRHRRITATGKHFGCLKFRTMHVDADKKLAEVLANDPKAKEEWDRSFKLKADPRVTRIGKFLRRTSLDELPQFWNVLVGDMSVVGARPIISRELYEYYKDKAGVYCSIKPGITGLWQVSGRSDIEDYDQRISLDMEYILNRSMWLDIKIIAKTFAMIFSGKGAY